MYVYFTHRLILDIVTFFVSANLVGMKCYFIVIFTLCFLNS